MATAAEKKQELTKQGQQQASLVINNAFIDGLSAQLKEKEKYGLSFPADYNPTNALMGAYLIMKETTDKNGKCILESCSQTSIANALMDMCTTGLNASKKQGYFIAYGGKCQFQKSYFGNITIARRYGMKSISAEIIYEGDIFKMHKEDAKTVIDSHEQDFMNIDNDKLVGAYAVAIMSDGSKIAEVMNIGQLKKAWNQRMGGLKEDASSTHMKFKDQMAKKTVINRLCKMIVNTYGDGYVSEVYDNLEAAESVDTVAEDVAYDIQQNANSEDFIVDEPQADETVEVPKAAEPQKVEGEVVEDVDLPDFMK
ncbi:recombinase RecT [Blautia coccoides]|uniref:recombinase RecT n=1 Tax=Blautia producta TaxID=33035 RepID=UPI0028A47EEC|nr:recombinase RecT [Blautia coccoides]MDT4376169.1 recombinase RecT [Blautia coccoides]